MMTRNVAIVSTFAALLLVGQSCSDDDDGDNGGAAGNAGSGGNSMATGSLGTFPGALGPANRPQLGPQIDRIGRPAISAALIGTFDADGGNGIRDQYNRGSLSDETFRETMETSLGILDGLDEDCGNQLTVPGASGPRYSALATVLLDDQLYLHSGRTGCAPAYLGLEAEVVGALQEGEGQCGGRQPNEDVIETSYSVLAAGALSGVDDGVGPDNPPHLPDVFPFLRPPQPQ